MSGINTLIDTLMHQVLGKRIDTPPPRDLNQPVKPMTPADAPSAVRSDSRLDARSNAPVREAGQAPQEQRAARARQSAGDRPAPASTQTSFTPSARSIADLLLRFPASSSAVRVAQPLFPASESPAPAQVADRLQSTVRDSGLFYESHLSRWFRGDLSREQLQREPQMWRPLAFSQTTSSSLPPAPLRSSLPMFVLGLSSGGDLIPGFARGGAQGGVQAGTSPGGGAAASGAPPVVGANVAPGAAPGTLTGMASGAPQPTVQSSASPGAGAAAVGAEARDNSAALQQQVANTEMAMQSVRLQRGEVIHESLQGLVRHQLELLTAPVLRWEGDVWSGIFMALMIQPPARREEQAGRDEGQGQEESDSDGWHSSMRLQVTGLGEVGVKLWLRESHLDLELGARDPDVHSALADGVEHLKSRLQVLDISEVRIRLRQDQVTGPEPEPEPEAPA